MFVQAKQKVENVVLFDRMMHAQIRDPTATEWQVADPSIDSPERGEFEGRFRHETKKWAQTLNSHALAERMSLTPVRARPFRVRNLDQGLTSQPCAQRVWGCPPTRQCGEDGEEQRSLGPLRVMRRTAGKFTRTHLNSAQPSARN